VPAGAPDTPARQAALQTLLQAMALQLRHADMAATDTMATLLRQFGGAPGGALQALDAAVCALDFERALQLCSALIGKRDNSDNRDNSGEIDQSDPPEPASPALAEA
jgi:hypothetical protein